MSFSVGRLSSINIHRRDARPGCPDEAGRFGSTPARGSSPLPGYTWPRILGRGQFESFSTEGVELYLLLRGLEVDWNRTDYIISELYSGIRLADIEPAIHEINVLKD